MKNIAKYISKFLEQSLQKQLKSKDVIKALHVSFKSFKFCYIYGIKNAALCQFEKKTVVSKFKEYKEFKVINWLPTK